MKRILLVIMLFVSISCNDTNEIVDPSVTKILLEVQNLPPLHNAHYQVWGTFYNLHRTEGTASPQHDGEFVSIGKFKVLADGSIRSVLGGEPRFGLPSGSDPQLLKDIAISVELDDGHTKRFGKTANEEPGSILIGGAFRGDATTAIAELNMAYVDAFRTNFSDVIGVCRVVCPTSPADSNSGIWFVDSGTPLTAGVKNLPSLPQEWRYEGWAVRQNMIDGTMHYRSTGKFREANTADADSAGATKGPGTGYDFPGQDFVTGPDGKPNLLSGSYWFMVTIEPYPDDSDEPFFLHLLASEALPSGRTFTLRNVIGHKPPTARIHVIR